MKKGGKYTKPKIGTKKIVATLNKDGRYFDSVDLLVDMKPLFASICYCQCNAG